MKEQVKPIVYWCSTPVNPNETLMVAGEDFAEKAVLEFAVGTKEEKWVEAKPLQASRQCLKAVVPETLHLGVWRCRVRQGSACSEEFLVNKPEVWWKQGEAGLDRTFTGGWLRLFGRCLALDGKAKLKVAGQEVECEEADSFALRASLPKDLKPGEHPVMVFNGSAWEAVGNVHVEDKRPDTRPVIYLKDDPSADPTGKKDSTMAFVRTLEMARSCPGGAVIKVPRGRFRIDGNQRPFMTMSSQLFLMENTTLSGEGSDLTSLWWPDKKEALPCLLEMANGSALENLALYAQGPLIGVIKAESNVRIENVMIRARSDYMTSGPGRLHHKHAYPVENQRGSSAIDLWGRNNRVLNCDVVGSLGTWNGEGTIISGNYFSGGCGLMGSNMIFENNRSDGCNIPLFGRTLGEHVYFKGNQISTGYGGDHECLTFDGHGTAYFGKIKKVNGVTFELAGEWFKEQGKGAMASKANTVVYVVDGRGTGQARLLKEYTEDGFVTIDRPWDAVPDDTSYIAIGACNRRHLVIDNVFKDGGTAVQLYPGHAECIVARNKNIRTSNYNCMAHMGPWPGRKDVSKLTRVDLSWYNQFLANETLVGNGWGGGVTEVDRWIGGEATMMIQAACRMRSEPVAGDGRFFEQGEICRKQQTPEWLRVALGEKDLRGRNLSPSRWQVIRGHVIHNNSSIRVRGPVTDVVIELCKLAKCDRGIRIDAEADFIHPNDLGMTFDWEGSDFPAMPFQAPEGILLRGNEFSEVGAPYCGNALDKADIVEPPKQLPRAKT